MTPIIEPEMRTYREGFAEAETVEEGPTLKYFYYILAVEFPQVIQYQELTDEEILTLADKVGTFSFLYSPEEDIYEPSDGTPLRKEEMLS